MKKKLTTLLFGLLLAVGWTSNASAQALPNGGFTKRMGLPDVGVNSGIVNAKMIATMPMMTMPTGESTQMSAPAQAPKRATGVSSAVYDKAYYQQFKYSWTGANGVTHENVDPTEPATDPYQIYELLRFVYGNPNFPGPTYSAYTPNYQREDPVYYGAINGGWDITVGTGGATVNTKDITINVSNYSVIISSIKVYDANNNELVNWDAQTAVDNGEYTTFTQSGNTYYRFILPEYLTTDNGKYYGLFNSNTQEDPVYVGYLVTGTDAGTLTIPYSYLNGATNVRVEVTTAYNSAATDVNHTLNVNGQATSSDLTSELATYTWDLTVAEQPEQGAYVQGTVVAPYQDGYTVVLVALKDRAEMQLATEEWPANSSHFETKAQLIEYIGNNIEYVRLLTDGLRIGEGLNTGTVFNCDGRLNRFFFLGKGQSRKKAPRILDFINRGTVYFNSFTANKQSYGGNIRYYDWFGEDVAFEEMYEQFSPTSTTVSDASQTLDLFDKLREGNVYNVQHDCGSVMQAEHEFSLAGKDGTEHFPFSGLNFFVPDYRLLFWTAKDTVGSTIYTVDGRDNVPYQRANTNYTTPEGSHGNYFSGISDDGSYYSPATWYSAWSAYYAVYNKTYAPKIGIYRITLDAVATFVGDATNPDHSPSNHNYNVTLTWVSSLNQMSGSNVPQTYTMYLIDENGNRTQLEPTDVKFYDINGNLLDDENQNPFHVTQAVYAVPQNEHSYTIEYQVDGVADAGPAFHATSNRASVVIPGWNDFVGLQLDHHESDFVITKNQQTGQSSERHNWYRNFVAVINEDIFNGLTVSKINGTSDDGVKMNEFNLYRFLYDSDGKPSTETKVATITFDQATTEQAHFTVAYENQEIEDYTLKYKEGNNTVTVDDAYSRANLDIPEEGWVRVKGNGDIVIWPNSYTVNFKSIRVYNGTSTNAVASWTAPNAFPSTWYTSPGSKWENYTTEAGDQVGYIEGGGYIAIPNLLDNYPNARVVIEAYGDAGYTNRIAVNDLTQNITATAAGTNYTWATPSPAAAPKRAGETQTITESFEDENVFPSFGLGGITATQHTGAFGQWKLYDSTGANVWPASDLEWDNSGKPQAWMPFNGSTVNQADAYTGNKYMESVVPTSGSADSWLISPELSGNAQTITFYERIFTNRYQPETYEVLYSTTDNEPSSFTRAQTINSYETTWTKRSVSLPEGAKYFAIRHTSSSAKFGMMVDDVTYEISNEAPAAEGGLLRLHLLMVDQLNERIPDDNSHPDAYGYVLRYEPNGPNGDGKKQSGTVRVNIQKTDCEVLSYYTLDQIDRDTKRDLTMDALTADVEFNLSPSNDLLNYYNLQAKKNNEPAFNEGYVTRLHRQENFTYREMLETSPNLGEVYPNGEHHYFDDSTPIETGVYGVKERFMSYAPSVSTWGVQRRYFEYDGLDNTYGAPVWKTTVGKVTLDNVDIERQQNKNNSVNWEDQGGNASLFMLDNIEATGYLPHTDLTKVEFEPYMFRVFVESENGLLRPYQVVEAVEGSATAGEHLAPKDGELTEADKKGPLCVWSGYITPDGKGGFVEENGAQITLGKESGQTTYIYHKNKVDRTGGSDANPLHEWDQDATNAKFGALDELAITGYDNSGKPILKTAIDEKDLKVYVRFYYNVKGTAEGHTPWINMHTAGGSQSRVGNGSEAESGVTGIATAVHEVQYLGEIVSQTYYNVQGMESDKPFKGVNIVVTRFSDGTVSTTKVVK